MTNKYIKTSSKEETIFIAKANLGSILFFYLGLLLTLCMFAIGFYQQFTKSENDFSALLKDVILDWKIWFLSVIAILALLNLHFRSIEFLEELITEKRWYWKTNYYHYSEISEIRRNYGDGDESITIILNDGKKIKIPGYLLNPIAKSHFWGDDLIEFLKRKIGRSVLIK